jgi:LysM repeat protein
MNINDFNQQRRQQRKQAYQDTPKQTTETYYGDSTRGVPKQDWGAISQEYIRGIESTDPITNDPIRIFPTLEDVASKYDISINTLKQRSRQDKWHIQRTQFLRLVKSKSSEVDLYDIYGISARLDAQAIETLESIHTISNSILRPYVLAAEGEDIDTTELKPLTTNDIRNLVTATKEAVLLSRALIHKEDANTGKSANHPTINLTTINNNLNTSLQSKKRIKHLTAQLLEAEAIKAEIEKRRQEMPMPASVSEANHATTIDVD